MRVRNIAILVMAALGAIVLATGCSSAKKDQDLATTIKAQMFSDPQVKAADVNVSVKDGEATLTGDVPDDTARYKAYKLASDTPGVKHVVDRMTAQSAAVPPPPPPPDPEPIPAAPSAARVRRERAPEPLHRRPEEKIAKSIQNDESNGTPSPPVAPPPESRPQPEIVAAPPPPPPPPQPREVEIPAGTPLRVQMIDRVDSAVNHAGDTFHASLESPLVLDDQIVVPAGTDRYLRLVNAKSAGHLTGQSTLALEVVRMEFQGKSYALVTNQYQQTGSSRGKRTAETVGGGAALGALLGAVIGHGKVAAIGAVTGAGAGTVAQTATKSEQVQIASESRLDFALEQPVDVSYFPERNRSSRR